MPETLLPGYRDASLPSISPIHFLLPAPPTAPSYLMMVLPGIFAPIACSACLSFKNPGARITRPMICLWEAFLLTDTASGATTQHEQQVFFWWLSPPRPEWVLSPSPSSKVHASWGPIATLGPPALLSTPPVESIPRLFPDDSWRRQFEFHIRSLGGEK